MDPVWPRSTLAPPNSLINLVYTFLDVSESGNMTLKNCPVSGAYAALLAFDFFGCCFGFWLFISFIWRNLLFQCSIGPRVVIVTIVSFATFVIIFSVFLFDCTRDETGRFFKCHICFDVLCMHMSSLAEALYFYILASWLASSPVRFASLRKINWVHNFEKTWSDRKSLETYGSTRSGPRWSRRHKLCWAHIA
jgi:hypothetical protein